MRFIVAANPLDTSATPSGHCETVGCHNSATHRVTWEDGGYGYHCEPHVSEYAKAANDWYRAHKANR